MRWPELTSGEEHLRAKLQLARLAAWIRNTVHLDGWAGLGRYVRAVRSWDRVTTQTAAFSAAYELLGARATETATGAGASRDACDAVHPGEAFPNQVAFILEAFVLHRGRRVVDPDDLETLARYFGQRSADDVRETLEAVTQHLDRTGQWFGHPTIREEIAESLRNLRYLRDTRPASHGNLARPRRSPLGPGGWPDPPRRPVPLPTAADPVAAAGSRADVRRLFTPDPEGRVHRPPSWAERLPVD